MGKQNMIFEKYVIFKENNHWECRFCKHESNGRPNRITAHLAGIPGKGIKVCSEIILEKKEELKRELGLTPRSVGIGQQQIQPGEEDDIANNSGDTENTSSRAASSDICPNQECSRNVPDLGIADRGGGSPPDARIRMQNAVRQEEKGKKKRKRASDTKEKDLFDAIEKLNSTIEDFLRSMRPPMDIAQQQIQPGEDDIVNNSEVENIEFWLQLYFREEI